MKLFRTNEIIDWRFLIATFEEKLKKGAPGLPATSVFTSEEGEKRWADFKIRIVEHVKYFEKN